MKHLKLFLKTLISNNACVEAARTKEIKYNIFAIVFAILALFLSVMPTTISAFNKNGSDWVNSTYVYGVDLGIHYFTNDAADKLVFKVSKDEKDQKSHLVNLTEKWNSTYSGAYRSDDDKPAKVKTGELKENVTGINRYRKRISAEGQDEAFFDVYYYDDNTDKSDENFIKFVSYLINGLNPVAKLTDELKGETKDDSEYYMYYTEADGKKTLQGRTTSFLAFGKEHVFGYMYKYTSTSALASFGGDYNTMKIDNLLNEYKKETPSETLNAWKPFFNKSYEITRWNSAWSTTGIMCAVNGGVIIFMGLMVFLLTRGKNNPFRIYSFWDGQKIAYYASFTPGVIGMALSFMLSSMSMMFFVLIFGIRVMWLSMRTLKPAQ